MGIPSEMRDIWVKHREAGLVIASPTEEQKVRNARNCTQGLFRLLIFVHAIL